jgi:hypothetical protein
MIFVPTESASSVEMVTVDPLDLQVAQERDSWHLIFQPEPTDQRSVLCDFRAKRYRLDRFAVRTQQPAQIIFLYRDLSR